MAKERKCQILTFCGLGSSLCKKIQKINIHLYNGQSNGTFGVKCLYLIKNLPHNLHVTGIQISKNIVPLSFLIKLR